MAHNPEVVGSSPASATKKVLKSKDFRTFSCFLGVEKFEVQFCKFAENHLTHISTHNGLSVSIHKGQPSFDAGEFCEESVDIAVYLPVKRF